MDERTKVEINQIEEMLAIYRTSVEVMDSETIQLMQRDLEDKKKHLEDFREKLNGELSNLYANGSDEIEVIPIKNEIQQIDNSLDIIGELTNTNSFELQGETEEDEIPVESIDEIPELEEDLDDENIFYEQEDNTVLEEDETDEFLNDVEQALESTTDTLEKNETFSEKDDVSIDFNYINNQEYEEIARQIIKSRSNSINTPEEAIGKALDAKNMVMSNIEILRNEPKNTEEKIIEDYEKDERQI